MERLTERKYGEIVSSKRERTQIHCSNFCNNCSQGTGNCDYVREMVDKLAEYEDLEEQGLLVKIECHCKDCVHWVDGVAGATEHVKLCTIGTYMTGKNGYCLYAEKKLAEMKGE